MYRGTHKRSSLPRRYVGIAPRYVPRIIAERLVPRLMWVIFWRDQDELVWNLQGCRLSREEAKHDVELYRELYPDRRWAIRPFKEHRWRNNPGQKKLGRKPCKS